MITKEMLRELLRSDETFRIERTVSINNMDKFSQAICAFSNDMPGRGENGYLLLGVDDNGKLSGLKCSDELNKKISAIRSDGNILPLPVMNVEVFSFDEGDVLVVEVTPSMLAPVRYRGRTYIRIGARKDFATIEEERILSERASKFYATFDSYPCKNATLDDIDQKLFINEYLPMAFDAELLNSDTRTIKEQMSALHLYDLKYDCPTYAAIILFGKDPLYFMFGAYVQYVRFNGMDNSADITNEYEFKGALIKLLLELDTFVNVSLVQKYPVPVSALREETVYNYPQWALRELIMNAVMHRDYQSNTPIKVYQYKDRIEITNAGGLFGNARPDNFPTVNDYRNPIIALAMKHMKYVNKYNRGVRRVQSELEENGNGKAVFSVDKITVFDVAVNDAVYRVRDKGDINIIENIRVVSLLRNMADGRSVSSKEIFEIIDISSQSKNYKIIHKMLEDGLILRTNPNPKAPNQRYQITEKGLAYVEEIK